jgi:hypothetical protein
MGHAEQISTEVLLDIVSSADREIAAKRWQSLEARLGNRMLKNSWHWIQVWLDQFGKETEDGPAIPHSFAFGRDNDQDIGAALIPATSFNLSLFTVPVIAFGTAGEPLRERTYIQYNQFLVEPEYTQKFVQSLMRYVAHQKWSMLWIEGFTEEHAEALVEAGSTLGVQMDVKEIPSPTFDFGKLASNDEIWQGISHDQRSKIRRSIKHFTTQFGPQSTEWAISGDQAHDILEELISLHTEQWQQKGDTGAFRTQRLRSYHHQLIDTFFPENLIAFRVKHGTTTIGCLVNLVEDGCGHITNHRSGFVISQDNRLKPGYITNVLFMQEARERGYTEFDFLDGSGDYKKHLTNAAHTLVSIEAYKGLRSKAFLSLRGFYQLSRKYRIIEGLKSYFVK